MLDSMSRGKKKNLEKVMKTSRQEHKNSESNGASTELRVIADINLYVISHKFSLERAKGVLGCSGEVMW